MARIILLWVMTSHCLAQGNFPHRQAHAHNDYDLGTANALEAVRNGVHGLHLTVNGMGERAGNAPLASVIAVINDYQKDVSTSVCEKSLYSVSKLVETFSGFRIPANKPVVGENVLLKRLEFMLMATKRTTYITTI